MGPLRPDRGRTPPSDPTNRTRPTRRRTPVIAHGARYEIDDTIRGIAASYPDPNLRSLDAIHLATTKGVFGHRLTALVTCDQRLLASAAAAGLRTASPRRPADDTTVEWVVE
jgi:hypothetical protein